MSTDRLRVAVLGASGYAGLELLRIVLRHPRLELVAATSEQRPPRSRGFLRPRPVPLRFESSPRCVPGR
jgi:N-acetyl-gamma-glutamyl-phosphate reductase